MGTFHVAVYAICKNEHQFIHQWMDSMSEADGIYVLDTGSTDGSPALLQTLGAHVSVQTITPWRFDVARNASLALVPEDVDICVCTDLDEVFHAGWREQLEAGWKTGAGRGRYRLTWGFNPDGSEGGVVWISKIHRRRGYAWVNPVHEILTWVGDGAEPLPLLVEGIQLDHHPDPEKSRAQYLPLLELAVREDPENDRNMHYLGREYLYYGQWEACIHTLKTHLQLKSATWQDERGASMRFIARAYLALGQREAAEGWFLRAIAETPHLREPWIEYAKLACENGEWSLVIWLTERALAIQERSKEYITDPEPWGSLPYDLSSLGLFYTGRYHEALEAIDRALDLSPDDPRLLQNKTLMEKKRSQAVAAQPSASAQDQFA